MAATQVGNVIFQISADIKGIQGQMRTLENNFKTSFGGIEKTVGNVGRSLSSIGGLLGVSFGVAGIKSFAGAILDATIATERAINALKVVAGDSQTAANEFNFVTEESKRLGLSLETAAQQYSSLAAASKGTSLQGEETRRIFIAVSEAATVLGLSAEQTGGALVAIQQIISKGKVSAEELRGQLGERLPGAFQLAARALGVTTGELDKLLREGKVAAEDLLPKLATELNKTFGPSVAGAVNSVQAQINRLNTSWFELKNAIGDAGFVKLLTTLFEGWTVSIGGAVRMIERLLAVKERLTGDRISNIADTIKALREQFEQLQKAPATPTMEAAMRANVEQRKKLLDELAGLQTDQPKSLIPEGPPAKPVVDTEEAEKRAKKLKAVADAIELENEKLQANVIELTQGKAAAEKFILTQKEIRESAIGLTGEIIHEQDRRRQLTEDVNNLTIAYDQLKRAVDATRGQGLEEEITFGLTPEETQQALQALDKISVDAQAAKDSLDELRTNLAIGAIDTRTPEGREKKRVAEITVDFIQTAKQIEELGRISGASQAQIAEDVALAWKKSYAEIRDQSDELTQFQLRAFERMHDALADITEAALGGQIKGWEDLGSRIKSVLDSILAQFIAMQAKILLFGKDYGKQGADIGGLLGSAVGFISGLFGTGGFPDLNASGTTLSPGGSFSQVPFRAAGGPVEAGKLYRVNEQRMEFFRPSAGGSVIPLAAEGMSGGRGGTTIYNNIDARGAQRGVSTEIRQALAESENRAVQRSLSTVIDARRRSRNMAKVFR